MNDKYVLIVNATQKALIERGLTDIVTGPSRRSGIEAQELLHGILAVPPAPESALLRETVTTSTDALPFFVDVRLSTPQRLFFRTADDAIEMYETLTSNGYTATMNLDYYVAAGRLAAGEVRF